MADWDSTPVSAKIPGLTQSPPGPYLRAIQNHYGGTVVLCIDVSGSMTGRPLKEAIRGAGTFIEEALAAHYQVGLMLWTDRIEALVEPTADGGQAKRLLSRARAGGGNDLSGPWKNAITYWPISRATAWLPCSVMAISPLRNVSSRRSRT